MGFYLKQMWNARVSDVVCRVWQWSHQALSFSLKGDIIDLNPLFTTGLSRLFCTLSRDSVLAAFVRQGMYYFLLGFLISW